MADATYFNVNGQSLLVKDAEARAKATEALGKDEILYQLAIGKYEGRSLASQFASEILDYDGDEAAWFNARIVAGDFAGIYPFDYFDVSLTDGKVFRYRVAALDPYYKAGNPEITKHHAIMVPDQVWPDSVLWNTANTNQGTASEKHPYLVSNLHNWMNNTFYGLIPTKWKSVIETHRTLLEERYSASSQLTASTGWSWADLGKVWSLSEMEVYGDVVWGTPGYSQGMDCHFSEFFKTTAHRIRRNAADARCPWWLRSAHGASASTVCGVNSEGSALDRAPTSSGVRPLPCFRVGV
jgi:hypothetical protein